LEKTEVDSSVFLSVIFTISSSIISAVLWISSQPKHLRPLLLASEVSLFNFQSSAWHFLQQVVHILSFPSRVSSSYSHFKASFDSFFSCPWNIYHGILLC
jgi:hypothetical protein